MSSDVPLAKRLDARLLQNHIDDSWDRLIIPALVDYIAVPAKSPSFDADWDSHGLLDKVVRDAADWIGGRKVPGLKVEILRLLDANARPRTPVLFFELAASNGRDGEAPASGQTAFVYGHLDKQPEFTGWRTDLGPWTPKIENGRLYGRGGADDGYAVFASIAAIQALQAQGTPHPRIVGIFETCEESGSKDLLPYIEALRPRLGDVGLVVCLDSGAGNYDQLWTTSSLRGLAKGTLKVEILTEGVHSGDASGLVPSSFRIMREVLDRLEESKTGRLLPEMFHCAIPTERVEQARAAAAVLGDEIYKRFPWAHFDCGGSTAFSLPTTTDPVEALLNRTWRPALSVTGAEGFPSLADAGAVLRPYTAFKLSLRVPPLVDASVAVQNLKQLLEDNAPYQARVTFTPEGSSAGWNAPPMANWLASALDIASNTHFQASCGSIGQGGTIPLLNMLSKGFPDAQMMVCGVLGPKSNAHGPNEFLHLDYARRLTACVAQIIARMP